MHSIYNEGKSVADERFIRTLKKKVYKYLTSISKNVYVDKLDDIVNKYNNTYHRTIKMKPAGVKSSTYFDFHKNYKGSLKLKIDDNVRISKYKRCSKCSEEVFVIKKVKNTVSWIYIISDLNREKIVGTFYEKE